MIFKTGPEPRFLPKRFGESSRRCLERSGGNCESSRMSSERSRKSCESFPQSCESSRMSSESFPRSCERSRRRSESFPERAGGFPAGGFGDRHFRAYRHFVLVLRGEFNSSRPRDSDIVTPIRAKPCESNLFHQPNRYGGKVGVERKYTWPYGGNTTANGRAGQVVA